MEKFQEQYEIMRPYNDEEVKDAMKRITAKKEFGKVLQYVFPNRSIQESLAKMQEVDSTDSFQENFSSNAVDAVLKNTASSFSYSGMENLDKQASYLFISNHRDIVMDSAILQNVLFKNGYQTTQITFGSNLMSDQFIIDLGKVNKMFTFYRGGTRNEIYNNALLHSNYIKKVLSEVNDSIWIAQRDGRTKDGDDQTQISLLKMLTIKEKDPVEAIKKFNIVPVSITYEIEPCDIQKVTECIKKEHTKYVKEKDEDYISILRGITGYKGQVHIAIGKPVNRFLDKNCDVISACNVHQSVVDEMDRQIRINYKLFPFNYVAFDKLNSESTYLDKKYSNADVEKFEKHLSIRLNDIDVSVDIARQRMIEMYASPVLNKIRTLKDGLVCI